MFKLVLKYKLDIEPFDVNEAMSAFGFSERAFFKDAATLRVHMTLNELPDKEKLAEIGDAITELSQEENGSWKILHAKFDGYESVEQIADEASAKEEPAA